MKLSNKSEYALLAMLELATRYHENELLQIQQIALQRNIPDRYLEQLLAALRRSGLIRSERGAKGGYLLSREPWKITVLDIVTCMEGDSQETKSSNGSKTAASSAILEIWQEARQAADAVLQSYTLQDLLDKQRAHQQQSVMYYI